MSIIFVLEFRGKAGQGEAIIDWYHQGRNRIVAADGFIAHRLYRNAAQPDTILSIEEWESEAAHQALVQKSRDEGWPGVSHLLAEPLDGTYHHFVSEHVW